MNKPSEFKLWLDGLAITCYYLPFNLAYFMLCEKYGMIHKRVPRVLDSKPEVPETNCEKAFSKVMLWCNYIAAPLYGLAVTLFYTQTEVKDNLNPSNALTAYKLGATYFERAVLIVSGVILLHAVFSIHSYFKRKNATDVINTGMLVCHGLAFGLYLLCTIVSAVFLFYYNINPGNQKVFNEYSAVQIVNYLGQFLSEILLCRIFKQWSSVDRSEEDMESRAFPEVKVKTITIDPDEDIQAKMWNSIIKKRLKQMEGGIKFKYQPS